MISLTYNIVDGKTWNDTYYSPGLANASNLNCYMDSFNAWDRCGGDVTGQALAHAYGEMALSSSCGNYTLTSDILKSKNDYSYYCNRTPNQQEFAYRFNEYNPEDKQKSYPRFTNRTITASASTCFNYRMVGEPQAGKGATSLYSFTNGTFNGSISIPDQSGAFDGTTYIYRGANTPQNAVTYACGPRCIWMWAHKSRGNGEPSTFYQCPITVSLVRNASNDAQNISDGMARLAAASIALQGRPSGKGFWNQYQLYTYG